MLQRKPLLLGVFANEEDLLKATVAARDAGWPIADVYTPYAVHGLAEAAGLPRNRLPWVCFGFALTGFVLALWLQYWIGAIDWPLNVGGRPFNSLPAYLPVTFELTVLLGGLGAVVTMLVLSRLYPGKAAAPPIPRATDDRFVLALDAGWPGFHREKVEAVWKRCNVLESFNHE
jgi:hypothetical protein